MKKFYSIIALVAMLCTSMFVATSCGEDDPEPQKDKLIVNSYYASGTTLSKTTGDAVSEAIHSIQNIIGKAELTNSEAIQALLEKTVEEEFNKLPNDVKYELSTKGAKLYFSISKTDPLVEITYDCQGLQCESPKAVFTIKSVTAMDGALQNLSSESAALMTEAAKSLNTSLPNQTLESTVSLWQADLSALAVSKLDAELLKAIKSSPNAISMENVYVPVIEVTFTSNYVGHMDQIQHVFLNMKSFLK